MTAILPLEGANLSETNTYLDEMADYIASLMKKTGKSFSGEQLTASITRVICTGQVGISLRRCIRLCCCSDKKAIEVTVKLGGSGYVYWEAVKAMKHSSIPTWGLRLDNMARLLRMTSEYGRKIGFTGDFYIEPKPKEPTKHQYDFDAATVIGFLTKYKLDEFKLNIEANHATLAGHTFAHELAVARINGRFGSIDANRGDMLLGWDTDQFPADVYDTTLAMIEVLKAGGFTNGGLNFDAKTRRGSFTPERYFPCLYLRYGRFRPRIPRCSCAA